MQQAPQSGSVEAPRDERHVIETTCTRILFPFIELMRRSIPFTKGVLTAIRPIDAPVPEFELPPFSGFLLAARFEDPAHSGDLGSPEIISLVHAIDPFQLNLLFVAHRQARFYRYGLVLEADVRLTEAMIKTSWTSALKHNRLDRLIVEREPSLTERDLDSEFELIFESYRTLVAERYVKLYFRSQFALSEGARVQG